jgi:hypothetical protein
LGVEVVETLDMEVRAFPATAGLPSTIVLSGGGVAATYDAFADKASTAGFDLMRYAAPHDYQTKDPATTLCFSGGEKSVCDFLPRLADSAFGDMFTIAQSDDTGVECVVSKDAVKVTYFISESDNTSTVTIPRCK